MTVSDIEYIAADESWRQHIVIRFGETAGRHLHFTEGFTIAAALEGQPVGVVSVYWRKLPSPVDDSFEGYIDIIEVLPGFRRQGIATRLIELSAKQARRKRAYQLRAWSSEDKVEAIPMWKALGFGLCPAATHPQGVEVRGYYAIMVL